MKHPEEAIERVLAGLREAEAPQGMERRILQAAQAQAVERKSWTVAAWLGARPWAVAAAGVVMLSLAASFAGHGRGRNRIEVASVKPNIMSTAVAPAARLEEVHTEGRPKRERGALSRRSNAGEAKPEPLSAEDALAVSEMNAPSKPAPPLPLTRQEKLLAEAVHQAGPEELASLRPEVRDRQMELSRAEFHDFFEPPPVRANE